MAQPVWSLAVNLEAKTANFSSGMDDAAKSARGSFAEIRDGAKEMGGDVGYSMTEARHGIMLLGEEFGVHLPRGLTTFIASLGPIGAAMEAAFPFLAVVLGATLLLEHLAKLKEAGEKLTESQMQFGTTVANVLNKLDTKLIEAGIHTDELNGNHLAALQKQLELIDRASLDELVQSFGVVSKAADATFAQLKTSWYQFGEGSRGAQHALTSFKNEYDALIAQGKTGEASDLLAGTLKSAEKVLALQKEISTPKTGEGGGEAEYMKFQHAKVALQQQGIGTTDKEIAAQQTLVDALRAQVNVQEKVNELKAAQSSNARQTTGNKMAGDEDREAREQAQIQQKAIEEANKLWEENYRAAVSALQENERLKIDATKQGSAARLAAIDAAIREENSKGLQETGFYKSLLSSRLETTRQMLEEENKLKAEAGKEAAEHDLAMRELQLAADREAGKLRIATTIMSEAERLDLEMSFNSRDYALKKQALEQEMAALDSHNADYQNKVKALHDKLLQLDAQFGNQQQALMDQQQQKEATSTQAAMTRLAGEYAGAFSSVLMGYETFVHAMQQMDSQLAAGMLKTAMQSVMTDNFGKEADAAKAARKMFLAGTQLPFPANIIAAPALAAAAFASVMAFETGGIVPGVGNTDSVPALLTPGESILPKAMTEKLVQSAESDSRGSGGDVHVHHHATYHIHAIDADGVHQMLQEHGEQFTNHAVTTLRRMNK